MLIFATVQVSVAAEVAANYSTARAQWARPQVAQEAW